MSYKNPFLNEVLDSVWFVGFRCKLPLPDFPSYVLLVLGENVIFSVRFLPISDNDQSWHAHWNVSGCTSLAHILSSIVSPLASVLKVVRQQRVNDNPSPDYRATNLYAEDTDLLAAASQSDASRCTPGVVSHQIWALAVELQDCYQCLEGHECAFCRGRETHPKVRVSQTLWTADTVAIRGSGAC